jgi:hypothetical protein
MSHKTKTRFDKHDPVEARYSLNHLPRGQSRPQSNVNAPRPIPLHEEKPNGPSLVTEQVSLLSAFLGTTGTTEQVQL